MTKIVVIADKNDIGKYVCPWCHWMFYQEAPMTDTVKCEMCGKTYDAEEMPYISPRGIVNTKAIKCDCEFLFNTRGYRGDD